MPLEEVDSEFSYKALLLMPLRGSLLLSIIGLTLLLTVAFAAIATHRKGLWIVVIFGLWLLLLATLAIVRYAQIVVEKIMYGYKEPPPLSSSEFQLFTNLRATRIYVLLSILSLLGYYVIAPLGKAALLLYVSSITFAVPAMLAAIVIESSLSTALNPVRLAQIIYVLGNRYVSMFVFVVLSFIASSTVASLINLPFINVFAGLYGLFLLSCAVGRLVYISRVELGLNIKSQKDLRDLQDREYERTQDNNALQLALQTSRSAPVEAATELWRYHERTKTPVARKLACIEALQKWPEPMTALRFAQPLTKHLIDEGLNENAIEVVRWCLTTEQEFRLAEASTTYQLGMFAANNGQFKLAAFILQDMGTRYPDFQNATSAMFKVASIAGERLGHARLLQNAIKQLIHLGVTPDDSRIVGLTKTLKQLASGQRATAKEMPKPK